MRVPRAAGTNAMGGAIAQVSGEVDQVYTSHERAAAIAEATGLATTRAVEAGTDPRAAQVIDVEDLYGHSSGTTMASSQAAPKRAEERHILHRIPGPRPQPERSTRLWRSRPRWNAIPPLEGLR